MVRLVLIPSYGTDSSLYDALRATEILHNPSLLTEWLPVSSSENLSQYAQAFITHYKINKKDVIIGTSLGGILAIEINRLLRVKKVIVISTIKSVHEKPRLFKFLAKTKTYRLFSPQILKLGLDLIVPLYGKKVASYLWFRKVFKNSDNQFLKWALAQIVNWDNEEIPFNLRHIHGTKDPLFPIRNSSTVDYAITEGTHAMIRFKAIEIAEIIKQEIS